MTTTVLRFGMLGAAALFLSACGPAPQAAAPPPAAADRGTHNSEAGSQHQ